MALQRILVEIAAVSQIQDLLADQEKEEESGEFALNTGAMQTEK